MHMADALLSPSVGVTFWTMSLTVLGVASRRLKRVIDEKMAPLMGVLGAFVFAAQMINFTIPGTGSSGHIGGGMLLAIALGPYAAFIVIASVITIQALFFADGGLLALGCNIWNMGIYPCFVGYLLIYRPLTAKGRWIMPASILSVIVSVQLGAASVVIETILSARSGLPFGTFITMMLPIHLIIGLIEGIVTAGVVRYLSHTHPDLLDGIRPAESEVSTRNIIIVFIIAAVLTGTVISKFASLNPDGLEWSIQKITGKTELPKTDGVLDRLQEKTAIMPDYDFKKAGGRDYGKPLCGLIGSSIVFTIIVVIGLATRFFRRR